MKESNPLTDKEYQALAQLIDIACKRGAYGAPETAVVGTIWNKIAQYLQSKNIPPAKAEEPKKDE
jgi:hypothetical protein